MVNYSSYGQQYSHAPSKSTPPIDDTFGYAAHLFGKPPESKAFYKTIEDSLPPIFTRQTASMAIGGLISPKTFANLDSKGQGPPVKRRLGTKVAYERESFVTWLRGRLKD